MQRALACRTNKLQKAGRAIESALLQIILGRTEEFGRNDIKLNRIRVFRSALVWTSEVREAPGRQT